MDSLVVRGGNKLNGIIDISGAKNSALPIMTASILSDKPLILQNIPKNLTDIATMISLLKTLGVKCDLTDPDNITLLADSITNLEAPYDIVRKMRASIWVLGPLLTRFGKAKVSFPGGCALGARQVDLHLTGLESMGATITIDAGYIIAEAPNGLNGTDFNFNKVSVGATINLIMAAVLAKGDTKLSNSAREPEITDLCHCLVGMGAKITGIGTDTLLIDGATSLSPHKHSIMADRIEAGTYMMAGAMTGGEILLKNVAYDIVENTCLKLAEIGVVIEERNNGLLIKSSGKLKSADMSTMPYPGFATDLQAQYMALMSVADGTSVITENLFENRFMHVPELCRMGANIAITGHNNAVVRGVKKLIGAEVMASDLRASVSLVIAGLIAEGETKIRRIYHLDRGYESLEQKLRNCGADIERVIGDSV